MVKIKIIYSHKYTAAFTIGPNLYYIKTGPDFPQLYDRDLKKLIIPNVDFWLQANTHQRHSFRNLCDMIEAFGDGINHSYNSGDLSEICGAVYDKTLSYIFKTGYARDFAGSYWIELLDENKMKKLVLKISQEFDVFKKKYEDRFYDYLCRIWQFYNMHIPGESVTIERLIRKLGKTPREPIYPEVPAEKEIRDSIITKDVMSVLDKCKNVSDDVYGNVVRIENGDE